MSLPKEKAWFPVKRYGYGWGLPSRWQGWLVILAFFAALGCGAWFTPSHPIAFVFYALALMAALIAICFWKGESLSWQRRERDSG